MVKSATKNVIAGFVLFRAISFFFSLVWTHLYFSCHLTNHFGGWCSTQASIIWRIFFLFFVLVGFEFVSVCAIYTLNWNRLKWIYKKEEKNEKKIVLKVCCEKKLEKRSVLFQLIYCFNERVKAIEELHINQNTNIYFSSKCFWAKRKTPHK